MVIIKQQNNNIMTYQELRLLENDTISFQDLIYILQPDNLNVKKVVWHEFLCSEFVKVNFEIVRAIEDEDTGFYVGPKSVLRITEVENI